MVLGRNGKCVESFFRDNNQADVRSEERELLITFCATIVSKDWAFFQALRSHLNMSCLYKVFSCRLRCKLVLYLVLIKNMTLSNSLLLWRSHFHRFIFTFIIKHKRNPKSKTCFGTPGMFLKVQQRMKLDLALCLNYRSGAATNLGKFH